MSCKLVLLSGRPHDQPVCAMSAYPELSHSPRTPLTEPRRVCGRLQHL